jgi:hypothetical protein
MFNEGKLKRQYGRNMKRHKTLSQESFLLKIDDLQHQTYPTKVRGKRRGVVEGKCGL